ncbi:hypothetical protein EDF35_1937 [Rathayibacter sp. PhB151]|uniref:phage tail tube protein n=1 Tax=Rathayibacter sp. PhB151 TaxID=2485189 RepID=UPI001062D0A6|nr:IPT/TIG domain-containing protein [Rathayibacter sp. PhB151]TDX78723.1 hypothetical protein EDF35_1937 [Rathayibacter sp. PhB151]
MNRVTLPAGFTLGKSFEYGIDANLGSRANPLWQPFRRISGFGVTPTPITTDAATYDDEGAPNSQVTGWGFNGAFTVQVNRSLITGLFLPEVEALLARTKPSATGDDAEIDVRWYHKPKEGKPHPLEAGRGNATVALSRVNTGPAGEIDSYAVTLTGVGAYEEIANPWLGNDVDALPVILGVTTADGAPANDGDLFTVNGRALLDTLSLKVNAISVPFTVVNDSTLVGVMPVGDAGDVPITATTTAGVSQALVVPRGA